MQAILQLFIVNGETITAYNIVFWKRKIKYVSLNKKNIFKTKYWRLNILNKGHGTKVKAHMANFFGISITILIKSHW